MRSTNMKMFLTILAVFLLLCACGLQAQSALPDEQGMAAQTTETQDTQPTTSDADDNGVKVTIYPILAWVPIFGASFDLPELPGGGGGGEGGVGGSGTTDSSFNGALFSGVSIRGGKWLVDFDFLWLASTTTAERPRIDLKYDIVYGHVAGGYRVYKDVYALGGVRRVALNIHAQLEDLIDVKVKPSIWDPLIGISWEPELGHGFNAKFDFEGGGFGVGADVDLSGLARLNWQMAKHFELTFGYAFLHLKSEHDIGKRTFTISQTLHGPIVGLGISF